MNWFTLFAVLILFWFERAKAVCPVCTVAVVAGIGLSRWLKVDDTISGVWLGGLLVSLTFWTDGFLEKKKVRFWGRWFWLALGYYLITILPLYFTGLVGHIFNRLWGMDKLILGLVAGSFGFLFGVWFHFFLKRKNNGRVYFPFQKVVLPLIPLLILSLFFYLLT